MENEAKVTRIVPVVAIRGSVVFPHTDSILSFGRKKSVDAVNSAFQNDRVVAIFTQRDAKITNPTFKDLYKVGSIATITQMMTTDGEIHAMVRGQGRIRLEEIVNEEPFIIAKVSEIVEIDKESEEVKVLAKQLEGLFRKAVNLGKGVEITTVMRILSGDATPVEIVDSVASLLDIKTKDRQKLLMTLSVKDRLVKVIELLTHEISILDLERVISTKTQKRFEDQMKKAMLREKKRTIEEELGEEEDGVGDEITDYRSKIKKALMPREVKKKAMKELKRLSQLSPHNPEGGYLRNYLDWMVEMPWSRFTKTKVSIKNASKMLDEDHYGLDKAKERILEFLSVMKLKDEVQKHDKKSKNKNGNGESQPTILCFVGPPGVGKTSIGKSIARSTGRKFARVSLGGIRDEAEIRGHRRTYVGALPGRIIQGIKNAGTKNPVFMLDEIDKLGLDYRGDPASALLEILDPEQNREFSDHYLEVPFDLSDVMFICTANVLDTIPLPLRDRMEIIKFAGYIEDEKFYIAEKYLWPKQLRLHSIADKKIKMDKKALHFVIKHYTREAGVRDLERNLATVARKIVRLVAEGKKFPTVIKEKDIKKFLGTPKYNSQIAEKKDEIGMSTGLAVTQVGGEIMFIEVSLMPGKGKLILTGQLGNVMKESIKAAFTWTKANWEQLGLKYDFGSKIDVHVHVPEGAIKKDGPSAGIAMATALISALTKSPARRDVGMTGEVTLRGRVLPIGGVKEKVIAGHRAGLKTIILPKENKNDMDDVPKNVKKDIDFVFVGNLNEVLEVALRNWNMKRKEVKRIPKSPMIASA